MIANLLSMWEQLRLPLKPTSAPDFKPLNLVMTPLAPMSNPGKAADLLDPATASVGFLDYLQNEFGAGKMLWRVVYGLYGRLAPDRGWPTMSEKALSQALTALGCKSRQRDLRSEGNGRPRELVWSGANERRAAA